ncbi:syntaxin-61 isoform X1 [Lactuca sativa]|uniref:syntaxin-61 isoform X1 n=1 Tax=Lactuca sativa TaxID=4236 RepID=UPI001C692D7A|nr:syntaxin-61 isoform X1 [Lactuca sativa]
MSSAQDPFYIVKEEIQESIDTLQATFHQWEHTPVASGAQTRLIKELLSNCESIEWQVDELEKAISVAARDPAKYGIDQPELERRFKWTRTARTQVVSVKKSVMGTDLNGSSSSTFSGMRQELMSLPSPRQQDRASHYIAKDHDDFISSESDRQMLLVRWIMCIYYYYYLYMNDFYCMLLIGEFRQQDEELDELSESVQRIGSVGLTIHDELHAQEKLLEELGSEMDSTSNRLDFVQKKVAVVMKKASAKGQMMMILFLIILFIVLFVLVFFT